MFEKKLTIAQIYNCFNAYKVCRTRMQFRQKYQKGRKRSDFTG